ncbi:MAG: hypothetical protein HC893_02615 [Chloroflexaceae bacterium]|nr:hypothetical protein [Chloroflexaceae bacterium]
MRSLRRRLTITHTVVALLAVLLITILAGSLIARAYLDLSREQARDLSRGISLRLVALYRLNGGSWEGVQADH